MCNNDNENKAENKSEAMDNAISDEQLENVAGGKVVKTGGNGEKIYPSDKRRN